MFSDCGIFTLKDTLPESGLARVGKVKLYPVPLTEHHAMKTYWGSGGIAHAFLTSALVGGAWFASRPGRFIPRERAPGTHLIGWVGPRSDWTVILKVLMLKTRAVVGFMRTSV
jgi:hypothetical protein